MLVVGSPPSRAGNTLNGEEEALKPCSELSSPLQAQLLGTEMGPHPSPPAPVWTKAQSGGSPGVGSCRLVIQVWLHAPTSLVSGTRPGGSTNYAPLQVLFSHPQSLDGQSRTRGLDGTEQGYCPRLSSLLPAGVAALSPSCPRTVAPEGGQPLLAASPYWHSCMSLPPSLL